MFANRFRFMTLALAGASILATTLLSPIAAAAPTRAQPAGNEGVMAKPRIDLATTDLSVTPLGLTADTTYQNVQYRFRVTNHGPDRLTFRVTKKALWAYNGAPNGTQDESAINYARSAGEWFDVAVNCHLSGDPSHYCNGAEVRVSAVNGLDTNLSNNYVYMQNTFQP